MNLNDLIEGGINFETGFSYFYPGRVCQHVVVGILEPSS